MPKNGIKGFTIIELLAVVIIIGVIAVISIPIMMVNIKKVRLDSFKESTNSLLRVAKISYNESILIGDYNEVIFTYDNG